MNYSTESLLSKAIFESPGWEGKIIQEADHYVLTPTRTGPDEGGMVCYCTIRFDALDMELSYMRGGAYESTYPPQSFLPTTRSIHPGVIYPAADAWEPEYGARIDIGSVAGRSSDAHMPYFLITEKDKGHGVWFAIGWSGDWQAVLRKVPGKAEHELRFLCRATGYAAETEEIVTGPKLYFGEFAGDGWSALQRFVSAKCGYQEPSVVYSTWLNMNLDVSEELLLQAVPELAEVGVDVLLIDGGWYESPQASGGNFAQGLGNWVADSARFPHGLEPIAEAVRANGMGLGLWFEPERAHGLSTLAQANPSWMLHSDEDPEIVMVNFGVAEVREWAYELIAGYADQLDLKYIRWDMNHFRARSFWQEERVEAGHIRGVWDVHRKLSESHPDLVIECCASGGMRLDIEILSRSGAAFIQDETGSPELARAVQWNARRLLPARYAMMAMVESEVESADILTDWLTGLGAGALGLMTNPLTWSSDYKTATRRAIAAYKGLRRYLDGTVALRSTFTSDAQPAWQSLEISDGRETTVFGHRFPSADTSYKVDDEITWDVTSAANNFVARVGDVGEQVDGSGRREALHP